MKQKLLPLLMISAGVYTHTALAADTTATIYGKANISLNNNDFEQASTGTVAQDEDNWTLNSNASRLGVKGSMPINDNLKAIYKLEYEIFIDDGGNGDEFSQRNIYGGLQGQWGTLIAGKHDTPLKLAQGKVDRFNDLDRGDIKYVMVGENRQNNIIMYTTPKFEGFSFSAAIMPGEDDDSGSDDGIADHISAVLSYRNDGLYLAAAVDNDVKHTDIVRIVGQYSFEQFTIAGLYQTAEESDSGDDISSLKEPLSSLPSMLMYDEQDAYLISGEWKLEKVVLKGQFAMSESSPSGTSSLDDTETTQIAFGADYKLNKSTKLFAYYAQIEAEADSTVVDSDVTDSTLGAGIEIKF